MTSTELDRLAGLRLLKHEPPGAAELAGLVRSAEERLADAGKKALSLHSRFDLAYNAAHALALAALRSHGYRSERRYLVFQCLPHTLGTPAPVWRLLVKCHEERNRIEYEGRLEVSEVLVKDLIAASRELLVGVLALRSAESPGD